MKLMDHQKEAMAAVKGHKRVAYYHDMGLGKTYTGAETMKQFGGKVNLTVCQKSKVSDWLSHFLDIYPDEFLVFDLTKKGSVEAFAECVSEENCGKVVGVINYDLIYRRPLLKGIPYDCLMLDESSLIQHESAKRTKFIMKLDYDHLILLSGTPTSGKYETLWSQMKMLGWPITKSMFWSTFVKTKTTMVQGFPIKTVVGYKNVDRLKRKMREHGCHFLKSDEAIELPAQVDLDIACEPHKAYAKFMKNSLVEVEDSLLVGDTTFTKMLYARMLCGSYSKSKLDALRDLVESTSDRLIVFYNFNSELAEMAGVIGDRPMSVVNGFSKDLAAYEEHCDSVTFIQYQAGALGLNLQKANRIIYFTPPLSSELFEQSKKRIHRIGQMSSCFYYYLKCTGTVEEKIYQTLAMRKDYTDELFREVQ